MWYVEASLASKHASGWIMISSAFLAGRYAGTAVEKRADLRVCSLR